MKYWINTLSRDHVKRGIAGGFTQANHGKNMMLKRLSANDWLVFYSPKTTYDGGEVLQAFTAIGQVTDDQLYQVEMSPGFVPWRRNVRFDPAVEVPIRPLITELEFITDAQHWGYKFRLGLFEISAADFRRIQHAMQPDI